MVLTMSSRLLLLVDDGTVLQRLLLLPLVLTSRLDWLVLLLSNGGDAQMLRNDDADEVLPDVADDELLG